MEVHGYSSNLHFIQFKIHRYQFYFRCIIMIKMLLLSLLFCYDLTAQLKPVEEGIVHWERNFESALAKAEKSKKPILLFFQEIPGCNTCQKFGQDVMSHHLIAEYIEGNFIPVLIHNNKSGTDAKVLKKYNEPAWNNPVLRIVNADGKDVLPRHSGHYDPASVIIFLNRGLFASGRLVPKYAQLLEEEMNANRNEFVMEMYCFWSGEKNIGKLDGVVYTEAGFSQGREVVKVVFDKSKTDAHKIMTSAKKSNNADALHTSDAEMESKAKALGIKVRQPATFKTDKEVHYYLFKSKYSKLILTDMQVTKINAALGNGEDANIFLSPKQLSLLSTKG